VRCLCHGSGSQSPACHHRVSGLILGQTLQDLWWTKWQWDRFLPEFSCLYYLSNWLTWLNDVCEVQMSREQIVLTPVMGCLWEWWLADGPAAWYGPWITGCMVFTAFVKFYLSQNWRFWSVTKEHLTWVWLGLGLRTLWMRATVICRDSQMPLKIRKFIWDLMFSNGVWHTV